MEPDSSKSMAQGANYARQYLPSEEQRAFKSGAQGFRRQYAHPNGSLYQGDSFAWLASLFF